MNKESKMFFVALLFLIVLSICEGSYRILFAEDFNIFIEESDIPDYSNLLGV